MSQSLTTKSFFRGGTLRFKTTFYDFDRVVVQPGNAIVNVVYIDTNGVEQTIDIDMIPPSGGAVEWTAEWDTRGVSPGPISYSIHTGPPTPVAVQDGSFQIVANPANLPTF